MLVIKKQHKTKRVNSKENKLKLLKTLLKQQKTQAKRMSGFNQNGVVPGNVIDFRFSGEEVKDKENLSNLFMVK